VSLGLRAAHIGLRFVGRRRVGISTACALVIMLVVTVFNSRSTRAEDAAEPIYSACHPQVAFAAFVEEVSKTSDPNAGR
jgi:di/tricarboxylate transporter